MCGDTRLNISAKSAIIKLLLKFLVSIYLPLINALFLCFHFFSGRAVSSMSMTMKKPVSTRPTRIPVRSSPNPEMISSIKDKNFSPIIYTSLNLTKFGSSLSGISFRLLRLLSTPLRYPARTMPLSIAR